MQEKSFILLNKGMNRDLSVSKAGESSAYENLNVRIEARDGDTLLSVTNEKGNQKLLSSQFYGELVGYNVLNNYLILFTHVNGGLDHIYRVDTSVPESVHIFQGYLGLSLEHPIESIVYYESESVQKIYWVDGIHPLRFMNFMESFTGTQGDPSDIFEGFDSNAGFDYGSSHIEGSIEKDNSGESRPNGVIQYFATYYNKYGQESGCAWISDLVYLSPIEHGGSADGQNNNRIVITLTNSHTSNYSGIRVYSVFRTSLDGTQVAYLVGEAQIPSNVGDAVTIIDNGAHQSIVEASSILFLGSRNVIPGTIEHKDQTLFIGNLGIQEKASYSLIQNKINLLMFGKYVNGTLTQVPFEDGVTSIACSIEFELSGNNTEDIPHVKSEGTYPYINQLNYTSSEITSFKGGELYRFALVFFDSNGNRSDAFWIGDRTNDKYPTLDKTNGKIHRAVAKCEIPSDVLAAASSAGFVGVQLYIAQATYSDRSIKAQGIINPTMFNVWDRFNGYEYSVPSWITRPRWSDIAGNHFRPVRNSVRSTGEVACNYWDPDLMDKTTLVEKVYEPAPYYRLDVFSDTTTKYADVFEGEESSNYLMILVSVQCENVFFYSYKYYGAVTVVRAKAINATGVSAIKTLDFTNVTWGSDGTYTGTDFELKKYFSGKFEGESTNTKSRNALRGKINDYLIKEIGIPEYTINSSTFYVWADYAHDHISVSSTAYHFNPQIQSTTPLGSTTGPIEATAAIMNQPNETETRWYGIGTVSDDINYTPAYYKKHLMFVDENTITLDSPELAEGAVVLDNTTGYKLRIIGIAWQHSCISDYIVNASHGKLSGDNLVRKEFTSVRDQDDYLNPISGIKSYPLWKENGLEKKSSAEEIADVEDRTPDYYNYSSNVVYYWLHLWGRSGYIHGYSTTEGYSNLRNKTFANLKYYYDFEYTPNTALEYTLDSLRTTADVSTGYTSIKIGNESRNYIDDVDIALSVPGTHKYPILFSYTDDVEDNAPSVSQYLYSTDMVPITYKSGKHAVLSLPTDAHHTDGQYTDYVQTILPCIKWVDPEDPEYYLKQGVCTMPPRGEASSSAGWLTGAKLPWVASLSGGNLYNKYDVLQDEFLVTKQSGNDGYYPYSFIGELYYDFGSDPTNDTRYGGIKLNNVANNTFIASGKAYSIAYINESDAPVYGTNGDTYIQRWDALRTKAHSTNDTNSVIDVASFMVETHINLDGRYDNLRGTDYLASIDTDTYGKINPVYTQPNNFITALDNQGGEADEDTFKTAITWTLEKSDLADIDEWAHITLGSSLKLDGDKGNCNAIYRFGNDLLAFQDKGVSEILFNSRTQISTEDGVPVEIANSGKVDGKRYISTSFGCTNKWSIQEGKSGLYFVDNINKCLCTATYNNRGRIIIDNISTKLGFDTWFRKSSSTNEWNPSAWNNLVSYYDNVHGDLYLVTNGSSLPTLVFNENIGAFTSFFDYRAVPMMVNVQDKFLSFKNHYLWEQNAGDDYCSFFGITYPFYMWYRATPNPYTDKVWTNVEYRADFYSGTTLEDPSGDTAHYNADVTFDTMKVWNEYQDTGDFTAPISNKKFRIWRSQIPRALPDGQNNIYGLDRIRNPWVNIKFTKNASGIGNKIMQLHDIVLKYFE